MSYSTPKAAFTSWCVLSTLAFPCLAAEFVEQSSERGITHYTMAEGMGGGVAAADFDNDGDIDLFVPNGAGFPDQLFQNDGTGHFTDLAEHAGVDSLLNSRVALWLDYDGDGLLDLAVAEDCRGMRGLVGGPCASSAGIHLYRQSATGDHFEDVTLEAGLNFSVLEHDQQHLGALAAGDINNDGFPELLLTVWYGYNTLLFNNGDGTFSNISASSGLGDDDRFHWQPIFHDFNNDGWQDIYIAVDFDENLLLINQHDNTFVDVATESGADNDWNDMGIAIGDYDRDGDFDVYVTNIFEYFGPGAKGSGWNVLLRNETIGADVNFVEVAQQAGVDQGFWGWGATFLDFDNNGLLDLAATNGFNQLRWYTDPSRFFRNLGTDPAAFEEVSAEVGFDDTYLGSSLISTDIDRDGDLDMIQTTQNASLRVLVNTLRQDESAGHWLVVKPRMTGPNSHAIGAVVKAYAGDIVQSRLITAGISFEGQAPAEAHFGLDDAAIIDTLTIDWPGGGHAILHDIAANQIITVTAPFAMGDLSGDGVIGSDDVALLLGSWGVCRSECEHDLDGDGTIGPSDLAIILGNWSN